MIDTPNVVNVNVFVFAHACVDASAANDFSGTAFTGTGVTTLATLTTLSTEFNVTDDDCSDGSPRFQVRVQTPSSGEKNVFVYLGPTPSFKGCSPNAWIASGNERRSYALLRPETDATAQNRLREIILQAYAEFEAEAALASAG